MPKFQLRVTQTYRVEKWITIEVEADTLADAIDRQASDDAPCSSLPGWNDHWSLESENVSSA